MQMLCFFFIFLFCKQTTSGRFGLKPIGVSSRNSRRYLGILLLRVLDVSPRRRRHPRSCRAAKTRARGSVGYGWVAGCVLGSDAVAICPPSQAHNLPVTVCPKNITTPSTSRSSTHAHSDHQSRHKPPEGCWRRDVRTPLNKEIIKIAHGGAL